MITVRTTSRRSTPFSEATIDRKTRPLPTSKAPGALAVADHSASAVRASPFHSDCCDPLPVRPSAFGRPIRYRPTAISIDPSREVNTRRGMRASTAASALRTGGRQSVREGRPTPSNVKGEGVGWGGMWCGAGRFRSWWTERASGAARRPDKASTRPEGARAASRGVRSAARAFEVVVEVPKGSVRRVAASGAPRGRSKLWRKEFRAEVSRT